jgi:Two component regulator propeller
MRSALDQISPICFLTRGEPTTASPSSSSNASVTATILDVSIKTLGQEHGIVVPRALIRHKVGPKELIIWSLAAAGHSSSILCRSSKFISLVFLGLLLVIGQARAQHLTVRNYDMRDGLAHSRVNAFHQDAKGYLWFGTWEGLSRFDGYRFVNYDTRDGLGHVFINSITEDRQGRLWVGTNGGGVSRLLDDQGEVGSLISDKTIRTRKKFASFAVGDSVASNNINVLIFDSDDNLWCGTDAGIYRSTSHGSDSPVFELIVPDKQAHTALLDQKGRLWFGCYKELVGFVGSDIINYRSADEDAFKEIMRIAEESYRAAVAATKPMLRPPFQTIADDFREHCDLWLPKPTRQLDTRQIISDIPTLVVHGEHDAGGDVKATQQRITAGLKRAYTYTFPGETHANPPVGCHGMIVQQFLENPMRAPDSSCLARMPGTQFKITGFDPTLTIVIKDKGKAQTPLAGTWETTLGGGPDWTMQLETDGSVVRGTVLEQLLPILDGKTDGTTLSFRVRSPDGARVIAFTGRLQGNELSFSRDVESGTSANPGGPGLFGGAGPRAFTAKRVR